MINRKLHIILFRLASSLSRSMTLNKVDDLERSRTARNFAWFRRFGRQQRLNDWRHAYCQRQTCSRFYRLDYVDICWMFAGRSCAIGLQSEYSGWNGDFQPIYAKYISQMISNTAMVTTIIENRISIIWYRPILCYRLPSYTHSYFLFLSYMQLSRARAVAYVVEAFKANPSSSRSLGGDSPNHNQTV